MSTDTSDPGDQPSLYIYTYFIDHFTSVMSFARPNKSVHMVWQQIQKDGENPNQVEQDYHIRTQQIVYVYCVGVGVVHVQVENSNSIAYQLSSRILHSKW